MAAPTQRAKDLEDSFSELEGILEPLFEKKLHETLEKLDSLDQAKLCVMIPYVVNQLVSTYLRAKGINPEKPYVDDELARIKDYFHKVSKAEGIEFNPETEMIDSRMQLDKDAANRFIKAALAEASRAEKEETRNLGIDGPTQSSTTTWVPRERGPDEQQPVMEGGMHTRFAHVQRIQEEESDSSSSSGDDGPPPKQSITALAEETSKKRKRPAMDPFSGGYTEHTSKRSKKKARSKDQGDIPLTGAQKQVTTEVELTSSEPTLSKNARKKARKKANKRDGSSLQEPSGVSTPMDSDG